MTVTIPVIGVLGLLTFSLLSVSSVKSEAIFPCVTIGAFWLHG
jgi:hypothetical protein